MRKFDFSIDMDLEIGKVSTIAEMLMCMENSIELSSKTLYGIGMILEETSSKLQRYYETLYRKEETEG
jgi:hypothetical protein